MAIYFYSHTKGKYAAFSNFYPATIVENQIEFPTSEHYYQAYKAVSNQEIFMQIATAPTPAKSKKIAWEYHEKHLELREQWNKEKYNIMLQALYLKFTQHNDLKKLLLSTENEEIYEDSPIDFVWGYRNGGLNLLGKALMDTRARIAKE